MRSWLNCENWLTVHLCGLSWVYVTSVKSFRNDWATEISLHLLDFIFPLCTCTEPRNSYMIKKEIVIDFIKSVLGETPNSRSFSHDSRVLCDDPLNTRYWYCWYSTGIPFGTCCWQRWLKRQSLLRVGLLLFLTFITRELGSQMY